MKIVVVGAGSIGLLIASFFAEVGMNVTLLTKREEQAEQIRMNGIRRIGLNDLERTFKVDATADINKLPTSDLWIVAVKYSDLEELLKKLVEEVKKQPLLFIQNGMAHMELAYETDAQHIAFATVEHGALRSDDRTVSHNGIGKLTFAPGKGDFNRFQFIEKANSSLFPINRQENASNLLLRKALMNCMINPLTAILQVKNGELLTNKSSNELFKALYTELMAAYPEMRLELPYDAVEQVCRNTARNHSSMFSDRLAGRPMEIETIVTAVIEKANASGETLPILSTLEKLLYAIDEKRLEV